MRWFDSHKNTFRALPLTVCASFAFGCASGDAGDGGSSRKNQASSGGASSGARTSTSIRDGEYYASNWLARRGYDPIDPALLPGADVPIVRSSHGAPLGAGIVGSTATADGAPPVESNAPGTSVVSTSLDPNAVPPLPSEVAAQSSAGVWALVLATFTEGDAVEAANRMIAETARVAPEVKNLRVHPTARGSMVVYGEYASREDKKAQDDRTWLKSITLQNRPLFPRIALTHLDLRPLQQDLHPYDLHMARRNHPKVDPLYTLDIAVWDDFGSGELTYESIQSAAERYARQLRHRGFEAYFFHDDVAKRSQVTVGLFDRRAINEISGLYNDAVVDLMKTFPQRLANGELQFDFADPFRPEVGIKPLSPVLVQVPNM